VLHTIYDFIARDEIAHCRFYQGMIKLLLEEDREGTIADFAHVLANFEMPGVSLVPNYDSRVEVMRNAGIDRSVFLQKVYFPILKYLGITRQEILRATQKRRNSGLPPIVHGGVASAVAS
jgi:acyl-[acyl-carrier-protein] desaturase